MATMQNAGKPNMGWRQPNIVPKKPEHRLAHEASILCDSRRL
eukprot:CAMPEP_0181211294 /NCGR_PEP_ID=MMETSP1096-20121128/23705_1 /TAXON_ID=156174 ORGANISM="Chrysochromulina ericina, Strain CCMP281" /NCGR_SAMPLE_ID=MMETSP1096 /ASSEMBLY_ACC=CAM_ASM_000453 /LENGTH=41 /DNA_ID= /DNA_START= /DNA_END= /DNA_ORIENTATION=